jgi:hypothetical protein
MTRKLLKTMASAQLVESNRYAPRHCPHLHRQMSRQINGGQIQDNNKHRHMCMHAHPQPMRTPQCTPSTEDCAENVNVVLEAKINPP